MIFRFLKRLLDKSTAEGITTQQAGEPDGRPDPMNFGYPPNIDDFMSLNQDTNNPNTYFLWLEEWSERYLGEQLFSTLDKRFEEIEGIDSVDWEDREIFLVKAPGLKESELNEKLWLAFLSAAREAYEHESSKT